MARAHFGVSVPQIKRPWDECRTAATMFEDLGYDSLWVNDHLYGPQSPAIPMLEAWSLVSALAAVTERVEIGTVVTPAGMRNPAHLGKVIATVDHISGGRIIPGLGGGWMPREFTDFDMPFRSTGDRLQQLRETVELLKLMWSEDEDEVTYEGKFVRAENVVTQPKPSRRPPIMIGGGGEKVTMQIAGEHADIWNNAAGSQDALEHKIGVLREHAKNAGRDPAEIVIGKGSGIDSVKLWLQDNQIQADDQQAMTVLLAIKDWGLKNKRLMTHDEFRDVANKTLASAAAE